MGYKERLLVLLREKALRLGDFTLASGKKSNYYLNCKAATLTPEGHRLVGHCLFHLLLDELVLTKCSVTPVPIGGYPLASSLATTVGIEQNIIEYTYPVVYVREPKQHGTKTGVEGEVLENLVVLEDVITTAGSVLKFIQSFPEHLPHPKVVCLVDRQQGGKELLAENNIEMHSLFTAAELLGE